MLFPSPPPLVKLRRLRNPPSNFGSNGSNPSPLPGSQGLDNVHKQRVAEVLNDPENMEKRRSRESLNVDVVKYESGPDGGEEVSMSVEWNGVSTVHSSRRAQAGACLSPGGHLGQAPRRSAVQQFAPGLRARHCPFLKLTMN